MKRIFSYFKEERGFFIFILFVKFIGTVMDLVIPRVLQFILDEVTPRCRAENTLAPIFGWGSLMLLCAAIAFFGSAWANRATAKISRNIVARIRADAFEKVLSLSCRQTDEITVPSLISRLSSDTYFIHDMVLQSMRTGLRAPILLIGGIVITLTIEPVLSLSLIGILPFLSLIVWAISRRGIRLYRKKQEMSDKMVEVVRDNFTGIRVIKALSKVDREKERFGEVNLALSRSGEKAGRTTAVSRPIINVFMNLGMTGVILLGAWRITKGDATPGAIISFMQYFTIILNSTLAITRLFTVLSRGIASAGRLDEILSAPEELLPEKREDKSDFFVEFRDVSFSYNKTIPTVEHISFQLEKGDTLGVIGGTGSGKSTLIALLLRFYDPDEGEIFVNGKNIKSYEKAELHSLFGTAMQNDFLMADTLSENIRFARSINESGIRNGVRIAQAEEFVSLAEEGLLFELTAKGQNLSGGQRQRTLIARAVAGDPEILILDDSSSALDYKTDANLRRALESALPNCTKIIVAQRISSVKNCRKILVLEHGELIGSGTHEELMDTCEVYREIEHSQMGELNA